MAEPLRGIGIGAGYFSQFQYEAWQRLPGVRMAAVLNRSLNGAQKIAAAYDIPVAASLADLEGVLDEVQPDFVDIITPPPTHLDLCRQLAGRGLSIICQKPFCRSLEEAKTLVEELEQTKTRLVVHENWRWQPWYREIKRFLASGELGEVFHMTFQMRMGDGWGDDAYLSRQPFFRDYERLLVFETGVHFLDAFRFLGGEVSSIYASLHQRNPVIKGEDAGTIHCTFESGATAVLDASRYNEPEHDNPRYTFGTLRIDGAKGHLRLDMDGALFFKPLGGDVRQLDYAPSRDGFAGDCVYAIQRHFVDCLRTGAAFESTGRDYLKTMALVEACYRSNQAKQAVFL